MTIAEVISKIDANEFRKQRDCLAKIISTDDDLTVDDYEALEGIQNLLDHIYDACLEESPIEDWRYEVSNGDTRLGYEEWRAHRLESEEV